ncbi:MAG: SMC-Scp complex subunit ScpB [Smithella sp.]|nr:SMC-Scp complex subunit ScpB [Smithella sp.]
MENLSAVLEALILSSESPLSVEKICAALGGADKMEIRGTLGRLIGEYDERQGGICIQEVAGGYQFRTRPEMAPWIKKLKGAKPASLSPAAMETLAIVAYRQPIVRSEIESIRGVDVSAPLKGLLDKKLVRILGRKDVPGKPIIYGTTKKFLEVFNLKELADLPTMRELREITEPQEPSGQEALPFEESLPDMPGGEMPQTAEPPPAPEEERTETLSEREPAALADGREESEGEDDSVS